MRNSPTRQAAALEAIQARDSEALIELMRLFLLKHARRISSKTLELYATGVRDFLAWAWHHADPPFDLLNPSVEALESYATSLQEGGSHTCAGRPPIRPATLRSYWTAMRALYRALEWAGAARLPVGLVAPYDYHRSPQEWRYRLPVALYRQLCDALDPNDPQQLRDRVAIRLMGELGLDIGEVVRLELGDLLLNKQQLVVRGTRARLLSIKASLMDDLKRWLRVRRGIAHREEKRLIINVRRQRAVGRGTTPHTLRAAINRHYRRLGFPERYRGTRVLQFVDFRRR